MKAFRLAHLSDLHFGTEVLPVVEALTLSLKSMQPDLIVVTGDITQRARRSQFLAARRFLDQFSPIPMISIPGNHDIPLYNVFARFFNTYGGYLREFKGSLHGLYHEQGVDVLTLNSTYKYRHVQGALPIDALSLALKELKKEAQVRIVAFHHPMDCLKSIDEKNLLLNAPEAIELFEQHSVDLIVGGHIHDPVTRSTRHRYPNLHRPFLLSVAGTSTSYRVRRNAPNSYNIYDFNMVGGTSMHFQRYEYHDTEGFVCKTHQLFERSSQGEWA